MKAAYLDDAEPAAVSHAVRDVLERRGALVSEHLHSRVRFRGLTPGELSWSREGYVGIYQHTGERDVELRLLLRARWPYRMLWTVALLNVLAALTVIVTNPSGTVWFLAAFTMGFALLTAGILYVGTLRSVRAEERALLSDFETAIHEGIAGAHLLSEDEAELQRLEAELDGEIARRRLAAERKADGDGFRARRKPSFSLRPFRKTPPSTRVEPSVPVAVRDASDDELSQRRAELLRRKAELEARRREMETR